VNNDLGRKVFFLYPPSVIRDELINRLLDQEYEVYMLKDTDMAKKLFRLYPDSICFVNIDAGHSEREWEAWIKSVMADPVTGTIGIGIVSYNADEDLQRKYLMNIGIPCGFVKLKLGIDESTRILLATLKATEAKGRRKYVRALCVSDTLSSINLKEGLISATGKIQDISAVGFSCTLEPDPEFSKNTVLHDLQLKLRATLLRTQVVVFGTRETDAGKLYVMLFPPKMDDISKDKIRAYIQIQLQAEIEQEAQRAPDTVPTQAGNGAGES
jgi:hypothetical protein